MTLRLKVLLALLLAATATAAWRWGRAPRIGPGESLARAAVAAGEHGDLASAIARMRQAILTDPGNGEYHAELGGLYLSSERFADAAAALEIAAHLAPERPHLHCQLAQALVELRRRDEALASLEIALKQTPRCPHALAVRGEQFLRDDNLTEALDSFRRVIELQTDSVLPYQKAAYILIQTSRLDEAEAMLKRGLAVAPDHPGMHLLLGGIYLLRTRDPASLQQAEAHLRAALLNNPEVAQVYADLGRLYLRKRDLKAAREAFERSLSMRIDLKEALYGMSQIAGREGQREEAASYLKRFQRVRDTEQRVSDLQAQVLASPQEIPLRLRLVRLCLDSRFYKEAERHLDGVVRLDPAHRPARELRAQLYALMGRPEEAARELESARRVSQVAMR